MLFKDAKNKLKELAAGRYHSINFELTEYADGAIKAECSCYIDGMGYTSKFPNYEQALASMEVRVSQHDNPQLIDEMMPDLEEQ